MIRIEIDMDGKAIASVVALGISLGQTGALVKAAAARIAEEHREHFLRKDGQGNKKGWPREHFWAEMADATSHETRSDTEAVVIVADRRMAIHVYGGTVRPREKRALTIPMHPMAKGKRASVLADSMGVKIFRLKPKKTKPGTIGVLAAEIGGKVVGLYVLRAWAKIPRDAEALPPVTRLQQVLEETVTDFAELTTGGVS